MVIPKKDSINVHFVREFPSLAWSVLVTLGCRINFGRMSLIPRKFCRKVWRLPCQILSVFSLCVCIIYTLWLFNIAMENCPFIDGLPIKNGDFP